jgi:hypothetical protein
MLGWGRNADDERRGLIRRSTPFSKENPPEVYPSSPASAVFPFGRGRDSVGARSRSGLDADANRGRVVLEIWHPGSTTERRGVAGLIQKLLNCCPEEREISLAR